MIARIAAYAWCVFPAPAGPVISSDGTFSFGSIRRPAGYSSGHHAIATRRCHAHTSCSAMVASRKVRGAMRRNVASASARRRCM